jgi:hypothetical protein
MEQIIAWKNAMDIAMNVNEKKTENAMGSNILVSVKRGGISE